MRKTLITLAVSGLIATFAVPVYAAQSATLDQRVTRLERMLENPVLLQLSRRLGEQQREIQSLQDENDRLKRDIQRFRNIVNQRYTETDERLSRLEGVEPKAAAAIGAASIMAEPQQTMPMETVPSSMASAMANTAASAPVTEPESMAPTVEATVAVEAEQSAMTEGNAPVSSADQPIQTRPATAAEKEAYKSAFALMRSSKYDESIHAFESFIQSYPESDLASNAAYWAGEGYLVKDKSEQALKSFLTVIQQYPDSPKVPDATLRAGDSYDNLGQRAKAVEMYQKIINDRPHSKAASNARKRLEK